MDIFEKTRSRSELIKGVLAGDPDCAAAFHRQYGQRISHLVWSLLGADRDHDDLVQMVFVNLLRALSSLRDPDKLDFFVDSVIFRTVRKELRSRRYRRQVVAASDTLPEVIDLRNPADSLVARRFYLAMDQMGAEDRMIFILRHFEHHSLVEMARISGWSVATVKRRVRRATESFKDIARRDAILCGCLGENAHVGS